MEQQGRLRVALLAERRGSLILPSFQRFFSTRGFDEVLRLDIVEVDPLPRGEALASLVGQLHESFDAVLAFPELIRSGFPTVVVLEDAWKVEARSARFYARPIDPAVEAWIVPYWRAYGPYSSPDPGVVDASERTETEILRWAADECCDLMLAIPECNDLRRAMQTVLQLAEPELIRRHPERFQLRGCEG